MGQQGWLTMRNVPAGSKKTQGNPYYGALVKFFKSNRVCPKCRGAGYRYNRDTRPAVPEAIVKYVGLNQLERLGADVRITDVVRDILEIELWGKHACKVCKGKKFIPASEYRRLRELRKQQRGEKRNKKTRRIKARK